MVLQCPLKYLEDIILKKIQTFLFRDESAETDAAVMAVEAHPGRVREYQNVFTS